MERRFCGKCGRPVAECICSDRNMIPAGEEFAAKAGERFENLALAQGETVVRSYKIAKYSKFFGWGGKGTATMLITNRRVICKTDKRRRSATESMVEEIALNEVSGVKTFYAGGIDSKRLFIGIAAVIVAIIGLYLAFEEDASMLVFTVAGALIALWMFLTMRKSRYQFSIYTPSSSSALNMGARMRGRMTRVNNGVAVQFEPTKEVQAMMNEMGACIMDLKMRGSAAIGAWKQM